MPDLTWIKQFNYHLPQKQIATAPLKKRDTARLLVLNRQTGEINHKYIYDLLHLLSPHDVVVLNQSKVFPARLIGQREGGQTIEVLLFQQINFHTWRAITSPGLRLNQKLKFSSEIMAKVTDGDKKTGEVSLQFTFPHTNIFEALEEIGQTPIPSYIKTKLSEKELRERYQTVFAKDQGSAAAPTAGLHFTQELIQQITNRKIQIEYITLHVGLGTFQSLREENFQNNQLHTEAYEITTEVAARLNQAKKEGKRIIAVGTTTLRTLEANTTPNGELEAGTGTTNLFIYPPYKFKFVNSLITNFHLPQSSLLMLVSAFTLWPNTKEQFETFLQSRLGKAYEEAIKGKYRFYSFGDAMWVI
jgi:S-adenosylmethionine:tRNA ribosyltransferase-isomerase